MKCTLVAAIQALLDGSAKEFRSRCDQFGLEVRGDMLMCYVRGQQGGWQVSPIPLGEVWKAVS